MATHGKNGLLSGTRRVAHTANICCVGGCDTRIFDFDTPKSGFSCVDLRISRVGRSTNEEFFNQ